jgi:hypothetical protein
VVPPVLVMFTFTSVTVAGSNASIPPRGQYLQENLCGNGCLTICRETEASSVLLNCSADASVAAVLQYCTGQITDTAGCNNALRCNALQGSFLENYTKE